MNKESDPNNVSDENNDVTLTKEEAALFYEAAVTGLLRIKHDLEKKDAPKSWFWRLLESGAGAAIVTVFIGGILGTIITTIIQEYTNRREFKQTFIKSRHDQALISFKAFSDKREEFIKKTLTMIGETINTADDYASYFKSKDVGRNGDPEDIVKKKEEVHDTLRTKYEASRDNWTKEQNSMIDSVIYYFPENAAPEKNFRLFNTAMGEYISCVDSVQDHLDTICKDRKEKVELILPELMKSFATSRGYEWKELTDPQKTKEFLKQLSDSK